MSAAPRQSTAPVRHGLTLADMTLHIEKSIEIEAPVEAGFDAVLQQFGPLAAQPDGTPMALTLEARPGGRWYRDTSDNTGHLWGFVQVIKPPTLLEIQGPMFMSYPVAGHISVRVEPAGSGCTLRLVHSAFGMIAQEHREGVDMGWQAWVDRVRAIATGQG